MRNFQLNRKRIGMFFIFAWIFLVLQGCQTPLIKVDVEVEGCCKEGNCPRDPVSGCGSPVQITTPGTHDGLQCDSGSFCQYEGAICGRAPGGGWMYCDTQIQTGTQCFCNCTKTPD